MCMANITGVKPACGDTSMCSRCDDGQLFACTSRTTFAYCSNGDAQGASVPCPDQYFCSVAGAKDGTPCTIACEPDPSDTCDRESDDSDGGTSTTTSTSTSSPTTPTTPTSSPTTSPTTPTTSPTTTSAATPTDASAFCQQQQKAGRFALPNDTVCTR